MADIDDPILRTFVREIARPMAEEASQTEVNIDFVMDRWNSQIEPMLAGAADADVLIEGRNDIPPLTVGKLRAIMASLNRLRTANTTPQRRDILDGRVRPIRVQG